MKIESLIARHLYQAKKVTIQNIGTFYLTGEIAPDSDPDKVAVLPENSISFTFDKNAGADEALIGFIMQQTKKIRPLAASDLESYSMLAIQFLNIGKILEINGIGCVVKTQTGTYEFNQGHSVNIISNENQTEHEKKEKKNTSDFSSKVKKKSLPKWLIPVILIIITVSTMIFLYLYYSKKNSSNPNANKNLKPSTSQAASSPESSTSSNTEEADNTSNTINENEFKIVLKEFKFNEKPNAESYLKKLKGYGHSPIIYAHDSISYRVAMTFKRPQTDTAFLKDSLNTFFSVKSFVDFK
ncbi:MAG: hypothetical protein FGM46_08475 [Ferruginibacter sp.]|nr:hypothetical protein [Ferruginibacter sp.]